MTKIFKYNIRLLAISTATLVVTVVAIGITAKPAYAAPCTLTVTNTNDSGQGSLRQAINSANSTNSTTDTICFDIPGGGIKVITPLSQLPPITAPAVLDASTQPGYSGTPLIQLSGQSAGSNGVPGLWLTGGDSTIRGLSIVRFSGNGIMITNGSNNNIKGNYVGLAADGQTTLGNGIDGVGMITSNNTVGGTTAQDRNIISGNTANGIGITTSAAHHNTISGNYVGTTADGQAARPNGGDGLLINAASDNTIGGTTGTTPGGSCTGSCNVLSGNNVNGIGLFQSSQNAIVGNFVGVNPSGMTALPNKDIGIEFQEVQGGNIGDGTAAGRNIISGNLGAGILMTGGNTVNGTITGNYIGMATDGKKAIGNKKMGISIGNSPGLNNGYATQITVGGVHSTVPARCEGPCNLISGNNQNGIIVSGGIPSTYSSKILGNYIGVDVDGQPGAGVGNGTDGVGILSSYNSQVGNGTDGGRNIISGNKHNGVIVAGANSRGNRIEGNYIGRSFTSNQQYIVAGNASIGIAMSGGLGTAITGNGIVGNGQLGIDIGYNGVTQNDQGDSDAGVNNQQNFPEIYAAKNRDNKTIVSGMLNSKPNTKYRLDFFASAQCNSSKPQNYGEGEEFIGATNVTTDQFGNISYSFITTNQVPGNRYITATASNKIGDIAAETSEFSKCILVNTSKPVVTNGATWFLKDDLTTGVADRSFGYGFPPNMLMCAWDPAKPGVKLPVVISDGGTWYFRASYTTGVADLIVQYGFPGGRPVCGDWDGDGIETVGMVSGDNTWFLRNQNSSGQANITFQFGAAGTSVVGDWDGDGRDTVGIFTSSSQWILRNTNSSGAPDAVFNYGGAGVKPVVGDWDGNGTDTIGVYDSNSNWSLRSANNSGPATTSFQYGVSGFKPQTW